MGDGYCDTRCNTTQCMFDGEDCLVDGKGTVRMGRYTVFTTRVAANKGFCSAWLRLKLNTKIGLHTSHYYPTTHINSISAISQLLLIRF